MIIQNIVEQKFNTWILLTQNVKALLKGVPKNLLILMKKGSYIFF